MSSNAQDISSAATPTQESASRYLDLFYDLSFITTNWIAARDGQELSKDQKARQKSQIVNEIINTEKDYIRDLQIMIQVRSACHSEHMSDRRPLLFTMGFRSVSTSSHGCNIRLPSFK